MLFHEERIICEFCLRCELPCWSQPIRLPSEWLPVRLHLSLAVTPCSWHLTSCSSCCTFGSILTCLHASFSGAPCLASCSFFWNLCGSLPGPTALGFYIPVKPASHGQFQGQLAAGIGVMTLWTRSACLSAWMTEQSEMYLGKNFPGVPVALFSKERFICWYPRICSEWVLLIS